MRAGQKRKSERKFFPGYVLVEMDMNEKSWHLVKSVPRVLGFIGGTSDRPMPITQREADNILNRLEESVDKPKPKTLFEPGEVVRVTDGPFADFNGVVEEVDYEKSRVKVSVLILVALLQSIWNLARSKKVRDCLHKNPGVTLSGFFVYRTAQFLFARSFAPM